VDLYQKYGRHKGTLPIFLRNLENLLGEPETGHITIAEAFSKDAAKKWKEGPIDLLFIDGNHPECYQDFLCWEPHMAEHGMIALHDTNCRGAYGKDGPDNTGFYMQQEPHNWKAFGQADSLAAFTREPEFWITRIEATVSANPDRRAGQDHVSEECERRRSDSNAASSSVGTDAE
jgi:hypothetical protein